MVCAQTKEDKGLQDRIGAGFLLANRYEIQNVAGKGGTSGVYKALDLLTGETVAIKLMSIPGGSGKAGRDLFRQEVVISRRLAHPNVVQVYDMGIDGETPFISMEYMEGRDLATVLREDGPLNAAEFLPIFRQLWTVLAHVHAKRVVHRDIKLANLRLMPNGTLKLMDFGIAQDLSDPRTVICAGTPGYVAPELMSGGFPSPQSDIYAAGLVCFELLTGRDALFEGGFMAGLAAIPGIPAELIQLLQRCIDFNTTRRPHSAASVLSEAAAILDEAAAPAPVAVAIRRAEATVQAVQSVHSRPRRLSRMERTPHQFQYRSSRYSRSA